MKKKLTNNILSIIKEIILEKYNEERYILLTDYYKNLKLIQIIIVHDSNEFSLVEQFDFKGFIVISHYIPLISIYKDVQKTKLFDKILQSFVLRDNNNFLINLKNSVTLLKEKKQIHIDFKKANHLRWNTTLLINQLNISDNSYLRFKVIENLVKLRNLISLNYFDLSILPLLLEKDVKEPEIIEILKIKNASLSKVNKTVDLFLSNIGGKLHVLNESNRISGNELIIKVKTKGLDLDLFINNIFIRFLDTIKNNTPNLEAFYWENIKEDTFLIKLLANENKLNNEIIPELKLKYKDHYNVSFFGSELLTIYDFLNPFYYKSLHNLSTYLLELKFNEGVNLDKNTMLSYAIELYIVSAIELGFSKNDFFNFSKYLFQKWNTLTISDKEILSDYHATTGVLYSNFEKLFTIHSKHIYENYIEKITLWENIDESFKEEIFNLKDEMKECMKDDFLLNTILESAINSTKPEFAFLEGFLYKAFNLFNLQDENKLYITYLINRLNNEI